MEKKLVSSLFFILIIFVFSAKKWGRGHKKVVGPRPYQPLRGPCFILKCVSFIYLFIYFSVYQFIWYTVGSRQHFAAILSNLLYQIKCACMYARMHTTATACGILLHAHLGTPLVCMIRLALLVVNSVKLHLAAYKSDLSPKKYLNCFLFTSPLSSVWTAW